MNPKFSHPRCLPAKQKNIPALPKDGDEVYNAGVMSLNISALLRWLEANPQPVIDIPLAPWGSFSKEDRYVSAADITRPIIVAEIAPDYKDFSLDIIENDWNSSVGLIMLQFNSSSISSFLVIFVVNLSIPSRVYRFSPS